MKYQGSKRRIAKYILPIILADRELPDGTLRPYVEPFCGGCNTLVRVEGGRRIAGDNHYYLIALLKALQAGWIPPMEVSEELYGMIRRNPQSYPDELVGYTGFSLSFAGKWFDGLARGTSTEKERDHTREAYRNVLAMDLSGIEFHHCHYEKLSIPHNSIIYCDPPYNGTTAYKTGKFNTDNFFAWADYLVATGCKVFVSEYVAPKDWLCVWEALTTSGLSVTFGVNSVSTEKLFTK